MYFCKKKGKFEAPFLLNVDIGRRVHPITRAVESSDAGKASPPLPAVLNYVSSISNSSRSRCSTDTILGPPHLSNIGQRTSQFKPNSNFIGRHVTGFVSFSFGLLIFSTKLFPPDLNEQSEIICSALEHTNPQRAQNIIDKQISKHEKSVITLKTLRNTFSPISKLPTEILCQIFYFFQESRHFVLNWIQVTYVCRQWRAVALNSPNLWTNLPLGYGHWTSVMLERSKRTSLTIKVDFSNRASNTINHLESAFHHVDRFKVLSLEHADPSLLRDLVLKLPKSAPRLNSLVISVYHSQFSETFPERDFASTCDLPEAMLCETENLHYVELKGCNPSWDSHLLSSLLHLKIEWVSKAARPTTKQFLEMLKRMPNLESLELRDAIPIESSHSVQEIIHLCRLHSLSLSSLSTEISNILRHITFPPTTRVKIVVDATLISDLNFSGMLSRLSSILASSNKKRGFDNELFIGGTEHSVQIQTYSKPQTQSDLFERGLINPDIDLVFTYIHHPMSFKNFLDSVLAQCFHAFPLDNLRSLSLSNVTPSSQILSDLFGTLNQLESMVSTGTSTNSLVEALQTKPTLGQATSPLKTNLIFPGLRSLALDNAVFDLPDDYDPDFFCIPVDSFRNYLKRRQRHGAELHELHLKKCHYLYNDDVDLFREFVGDVHWDKIEQELSYEESEEEDDENEMEFGAGYDGYYDSEYDSEVDSED